MAEEPASGLVANGVRSLQRTAGNAAVSALLRTNQSPARPSGRAHATAGGASRVVQRNEESAALLKGLAEPKILEFESAQVEVQKDIVAKLEAAINGQKATLRAKEQELAAVEVEAAALAAELWQLMPSDEESDEGAEQPQVSEELQRRSEAIAKKRRKAERAVEQAESRQGRWNDSVMVLGAIELTALPPSNTELLRNATLVDLPSNRNSLDKSSAFDLVETAGMKEKVVANTLNTMIEAGQIEYLRKSGLVGAEWMVLVEVHYYRSRDQDRSQFHKDTQGQTLFVNLNYHTEHAIAGPEYVLHPPTVPEHEAQIANTLPPEFISDLGAIRKDVKEPTEIEAPIIPAHGAVAFVDETIHHMTPLRGHREVSGLSLATYLKERYPGDYEEGRFPPAETWRKWVEMSQVNEAKYTRPDFLKAGMREDEIDELLTAHGGSGFQTVSIPGATAERGGTLPLGRQSQVPLKRRMSQRALREELPRPVTGERRFFRTWVRAERRR